MLQKRKRSNISLGHNNTAVCLSEQVGRFHEPKVRPRSSSGLLHVLFTNDFPACDARSLSHPYTPHILLQPSVFPSRPQISAPGASAKGQALLQQEVSMTRVSVYMHPCHRVRPVHQSHLLFQFSLSLQTEGYVDNDKSTCFV